MKTIYLMVFLAISTIANEFNYNETNLKSYTVEVLSSLDKSFVINDDMIGNITIFHKENQNSFSFLKSVLKSNNYSIEKFDNIYYINKLPDIEKTSKDEDELNTTVRYIHLNFLNYADIENICKLYKVDFVYLKETNKLAVDTTYDKYKQIKSSIELLDVLPQKVKIKFSIFETNLNKLKEHEALIDFNFTGSQKAIFDIFLGSAIKINNKADYSNVASTLKFLNTNGITKNLTSTIINLQHNKEYILNTSDNIPYLVTSNQIEDTKVNEVNSYEYKDIGLILKIKPKIVNDLVNLDLDFNYSQLLSNDDNIPISTKKALNQNFTLNKNKKYFLLSGINNNSNVKKFKNVPVLSEIPILGEFFKYKKIDSSSTTTTILVEIIEFDYLDNFSDKNDTLILKEFDSCKYLNFCD